MWLLDYNYYIDANLSVFIENMDDPIDSAFQSRRFAHGKSKAKSGRTSGRSGGASKPFNPLAALGRYEVSLGAGASSTSQHVLEIHELTKSETGLLGTFDFAKLSGMFVLAGSRKQLAQIITGFEEDSDNARTGRDDDDDDDEEDDDDEGKSHESQDDDAEEESGNEPSAFELQDEKVNRRARAFEKNSFRNPKFWMKWKGTSEQEPSGAEQGSAQVETDMGYLVFANNGCDKFEGTITCPSLEWKQLKLKGRKVTSKARSCPATWNEGK